MKMKHHIYRSASRCSAMLMAVACAMGVFAQNTLQKEITIEKEFVPTERKAEKKSLLPSVVKQDVPMNKPSYSLWSEPVNSTPQVALLDPYGYKTTKDFSTYRGYMRLLGGSYLNMSLSAGYRIIADEHADLGIRFQHCSSWLGYNKSPNLLNDATAQKQKFNDNVLGAHWRKELREGTLTLLGLLQFDSFNYYGTADPQWAEGRPNQVISDVLLSGNWIGRPLGSPFSYKVDARFSHVGFSKSLWEEIKPTKQSTFGMKFNGEYQLTDKIFAGGDVGFDYLCNSDYTNFDFRELVPIESGLRKSMGMITVSPYALFMHSRLMVKLGVKLDFSFNDGTAVRVAPNVDINVHLGKYLNAFAKINGGKDLSLLHDVIAVTRYVSPNLQVTNAYTPLNIEGGFKVGPYKGFDFTLLAGYTKVRDLPMPFVAMPIEPTSSVYLGPSVNDMYASTFLHGVTLDGWKIGAEMGYNYNHLVEVKGKLMYSPQDCDKGIALGMDRPKWVANFGVGVKPIKALSLNVGLEWRGKRGVYSYLGGASTEHDNWTVINSLGDVLNLQFNATYQITPMIGVTAKATNLLNRRYDLFYCQGAQRIAVMGGVNIKF